MNRRPGALRWVTAAVLLLTVAPARGEWSREERRRQVPLDKMMLNLERPGREQEMQPGLVLDLMGVGRGDSVADLGAGTGFFAFRMAARVGPEGRVYAVEIEDRLLDYMSRKKEQDKVANLVLVKSSDTGPNLPPASCDQILVSGSYYYFPDPVAFMGKIRAALKPGGLLAIVDLDSARMSETAKAKFKGKLSSAPEVIEVVKQAGFVFRESLDFVPQKFLLLFGDGREAPAKGDSPPAPVPRTGQADCYTGRDSVLPSCDRTGQDGEARAGVPWPVPRFADNADGSVTDTLTGLAWTRDANPAGGYRTWRQALDWIRSLNSGNHLGHGDWRLPNVNELESLLNKDSKPDSWLASQGFSHVGADYYWSSTTYASYAACAWGVSLYAGLRSGRAKTEGGFVWPVRSNRAPAAPLPRTGQTACFDEPGAAVPCAGSGQDGEWQAGAAWPSPRFTDHGDRTVTDLLTGLVWSRDGKAPGPVACATGAYLTWQEALDQVHCLNANGYLGRSDWRLPNRNELATLVNHGQADSAAWLNTQGFANVEPFSYWSSTTYAPVPWNAWTIGMHDGAVTTWAKTRGINVWPVRSAP